MKKVPTKVLSILMCIGLVAGLAPGVFATEPTTQTFEHDGVTYTLTISYSENGQQIATVTGGGLSTSAQFEDGMLILTETNLVTRETTTTVKDLNEDSEFTTASSNQNTRGYYSEKSQYFNVGYEVTTGSGIDYWMIWNTENIGKAVNVPPTDINRIEKFQEEVGLCCDYEQEFNYEVGSNIIYSVVNALSGVNGISAIAAVLGLFGIPLAVATIWDNAQRAAANADYHYDHI